MGINVGEVLAAYQKGGGTSGKAISGTVEAGGENFSDVLKNFAGDTVKKLEEGEQAAVASATGKGSVANLVTAISEAELALQTVVTIRDKAIAAYQDIIKTPI